MSDQHADDVPICLVRVGPPWGRRDCGQPSSPRALAIDGQRLCERHINRLDVVGGDPSLDMYRP